jgi:seryl-tRNA synthetase
MLDLNFIRNHLSTVKQKIEAKGIPFDEHDFLKRDTSRRELVTRIEQLKNQKNQLAKEIGQLKRQSLPAEKELEASKRVGEEIETIEQETARLDAEFLDFLLTLPNLFDDSVPIGRDAEDNRLVRDSGAPPDFAFPPKPHWDLGEQCGGLDFNRAAKITGARFVVYRGRLAALERALISFMLEVHTGQHGYTEIIPPYIVNEESLIGTGNLPKFKDDLFKLEGLPYYLIPTAEVPLTNLFRDETLAGADLPIRLVAATPCFRSEAGSHGRDVRGIIRQHQFHKVELLQFVHPSRSMAALEELTGHAERILQLLELPYRVMLLCSRDMSFSSAKTYDLEVWMPERGKYVEISSCSNFADFQARRARVRYKEAADKGFAHTLNGSGLAIGRTLAAILENYQQSDGRIRIPEVLRKYFNGEGFIG